MKRRHLFEFTDQPWCPDRVRRLVTDYLRFVLHATGAHRAMAPVLARLLRGAGATSLLDLCSGAAGPVVAIQRQLAAEGLPVRVTLTDRYPHPGAWEQARAASVREGRAWLDYVAAPVDATRVPAGLDGARTLFNCLHHFAPEDARALLADAAARRAPIAVFEITERRWRSVVFSVLLAPLILLITPFIRPLTWWRLALTYLLPVAPLCIAWEALVSSLRSYTVDELRALAAEAGELAPAPYVWEAGQVRHLGLPITYLIGRPR